MKSKSCLLIEDDELSVQLIESYIQKIPYIHLEGVCSSYADAYALITQQKFDFILLDVLLNDPTHLTGLDLLRTVPSLPPVVVITSTAEFAVDSYEIGKAVDFLLKPFDFSRFVIAINRALNIQNADNQLLTNDFIFLKMGRRFQRFELEEIDYIEAYGIYVKVIVGGIPHVVNDLISNLEATLSRKKFMRVHKSYIVNLSKVVGFDHNKLYIKNGSVPIGISYKEKLDVFLRLFDEKAS